ncbi:MAG: hypothetical protein RLZZ127_2337, partial [Planctomycetota bacterium]
MRRLRHACALLLAVAAALPGEEPFAIEAPSPTLDPDGAMVARQGFVLRLGERLLVGDALRWHQARDEVFAQGRILYTEPGLRLTADRIGLRPAARTGDAWDVEAVFEIPGRPGPLAQEPRRLRLRAAQVALGEDRLVFTDVEADSGHGGALGFRAPRITAHLRRDPAADRAGAGRWLEGIAIDGPAATVGGVPVLWLPWLYRDFVIDYPWNRFEAGRTNRQGFFFRWWLGTALPPLAGWRTFVGGRVDANSRNGEGVGAFARWRHADLGRGDVSWLRYPQEQVRSPADDRTTIDTRRQEVVDARHRVGGGLGAAGAWGAAAQWLQVPEREERVPGVPEEQPGLRFRSDYLADDVRSRPYGRRSLGAAAATPLLTVGADLQRRVADDDPSSERWAAMRLGLVPVRIAGPVHAVGDAEVADLRRRLDDDRAVRTRWAGGLAAGDWIGLSGLGWDAAAGLRGLRYDDGRLAGAEVEDEGRGVPVASAGLSWRSVGEDGRRTLVLTPRIGVDLSGEGIGDGLEPWRFDSDDGADEDRRWLVTGISGRLSDRTSGLRFRAGIEARWAMREWDRRYDDDLRLGPGPLGPVEMELHGRPTA